MTRSELRELCSRVAGYQESGDSDFATGNLNWRQARAMARGYLELLSRVEATETVLEAAKDLVGLATCDATGDGMTILNGEFDRLEATLSELAATEAPRGE